jgi:Tfp pilus assembly protein PilN
MLRVNLLPAYLGEQKKRTTHYVLAGLLLTAVVGAMLGWHFGQVKPAELKMAEEAADADRRATEVETLRSKTDTLETTIKPLKDKVNFVKQVRWYNGLRPRIFEQAARYTDPRVEYTSMAVTGDTLAIKGRVKKLSDAANYYLAMSANPDVKAVGWKGIYGWPNTKTNQTVGPGQQADPNAAGFDIDVVAQLTSSVAAPAPPGGGSAVGGGAGGAGGGGGGGRPSGPPGGYGGGGAAMGGDAAMNMSAGG